MKLTQKGQVTIPKEMRDRYGLQQGSDVEFEAIEGGVLVRSVSRQQADRMAEAIASIRGCADSGLSTEAIMEMTRDSGYESPLK